MAAPDRRTEKRVTWKGEVHLIVHGADPIAATITDISEMGCGFHVDRPVETGIPIGIQGDGFEAEGTIRHCNRHTDGFQLGIELKPLA